MNRKGTTTHSTMKKSSTIGVKPLIVDTKPNVDSDTIELREFNHAEEALKVGLPHDQLLTALYWVWDFMERASINFYVVGATGEAVRAKKDLFGDRVMVAVRKNEWESGARRIADAFAPPTDDSGSLVTYEYNGVPVELYVLEDSPTLSSFDTTIYGSEYFKLPNSKEQFEKEFSWLK